MAERRARLPSPVATTSKAGSSITPQSNTYSVVVDKLPYGMEMLTAPAYWPRVVGLAPGMGAESAGVKCGDVVLEVAGIPVNVNTAASTMQAQTGPFVVKFSRPQRSMKIRGWD